MDRAKMWQEQERLLAEWKARTKQNANRLAGQKAAETKGPDERERAALLAAWTRANGKDDEQPAQPARSGREEQREGGA